MLRASLSWDVGSVSDDPANTGRSSSVVLMLGQRRRRWANIKTTLVKCPVFAGEHTDRQRLVFHDVHVGDP